MSMDMAQCLAQKGCYLNICTLNMDEEAEIRLWRICIS